jgi:hypothetical protein
MGGKITVFVTLVVDFGCKIGQYLHVNSEDTSIAHKIFSCCYENVVKNVVNSATSVHINLSLEYFAIEKMWAIFIELCLALS